VFIELSVSLVAGLIKSEILFFKWKSTFFLTPFHAVNILCVCNTRLELLAQVHMCAILSLGCELMGLILIGSLGAQMHL
jgi:hypothetical protein